MCICVYVYIYKYIIIYINNIVSPMFAASRGATLDLHLLYAAWSILRLPDISGRPGQTVDFWADGSSHEGPNGPTKVVIFGTRPCWISSTHAHRNPRNHPR